MMSFVSQKVDIKNDNSSKQVIFVEFSMTA